MPISDILFCYEILGQIAGDDDLPIDPADRYILYDCCDILRGVIREYEYKGGSI